MLIIGKIIKGYFILEVVLFTFGMFVVAIEKAGFVKGHRKLVEVCVHSMKINIKWMLFFMGVYLVLYGIGK